MKKLLLLLFIIIGNFTLSSQDYEGSGTPGHADGITPLHGDFVQPEAPIQYHLAEGLMFIDAPNTHKFLLGTDYDKSMSKIVGMIVPDTLTDLMYMDKYWLISYEEIGHVGDKKAEQMDYSWMLNAMRQDDDSPHYSWGWSPSYDREKHALSLPFVEKGENESILLFNKILFGNYGLIKIQASAPASDFDWVHDNEMAITNSMEFAPGDRYEDFNPQENSLMYNSVYAYLNGVPATSSSMDEHPELYGLPQAESGENSFEAKSLLWIVVSAAVILVIMLILMGAVALTNRKKENAGNIRLTSINVLLRIGVFTMGYLLILTSALFCIWIMVELTIYMFNHGLPVRLILIGFCVWIAVLGYLYAIVRSLFHFSKRENPDGLEISRGDAPLLFDLIEETAGELGQKMPKHVYVYPDVNASVFYDNPLKSILKSGDKNLQIGVGLLWGMNRHELKAVLAHEFGHFGQDSMRVSLVISKCYTIINNLATNQNASILRPVLKMMAGYVHRGFMMLSRRMEYEADHAAASVVGRNAMVSSLCKIEVIAGRYEIYKTVFMNVFKSSKKLPLTYWSGFMTLWNRFPQFDGISIEYGLPATGPLKNTVPSRVNLKDPWLSHPTLQERIANLESSPEVAVDTGCDAHDLIPQELIDNISEVILSAEMFAGGEKCPADEYENLMTAEIEDRTIPLKMRPFLDRSIEPFDIEKASNSDQADEDVSQIFSEENTRIMTEYSQAIDDYKLMVAFNRGQTEENRIGYEGKVYRRKTVPLERQLEFLKSLQPRVAAIDERVFRLALRSANDSSLIQRAYDDIFFAQHFRNQLANEILPQRDTIAKMLASVKGELNGDTFRNIQFSLLSLKGEIEILYKNIEHTRLSPVISQEMVDYFQRIENSWMLKGSTMEGDDIQYVLQFPDYLNVVLHNLIYYSVKIVTDTIEGKELQLHWKDSVAAHVEKFNSES